MSKLTYNEDERGYFRELFKFAEGLKEIKQVSKFTINPGKTRGGHYHKETYEVFIVEKGSVTFDFENSSTGEKTTIQCGAQDGRSFIVAPGCIHTLTSETGCEIIVLSSKIFDPNDPDTFKKENSVSDSN